MEESRDEARGRDDIDEAAQAVGPAASPCPSPSPFQSLLDQTQASINRLSIDSQLADVEESVDEAIQLLGALPQEDGLSCAIVLHHLAELLFKHHLPRTDARSDLEQAIALSTRAVDAAPNHPRVREHLTLLGECLARRFDEFGDPDDAAKAIETTMRTLDATPLSHPQRTQAQLNLAAVFHSKFAMSRDLDDLGCAIEVATNALDELSTTEGSVEQRQILDTLVGYHSDRFGETESIDDMETMINTMDRLWTSVGASPEEFPEIPILLDQLGLRLERRFEAEGDVDDLGRAVEAAVRAVATTVPDDNEGIANRLAQVSDLLGQRTRQTGSVADMDRAIDSAVKAVALVDQSSPSYLKLMESLVLAYADRYESMGTSGDLDRAISAQRDVIAGFSSLDPDHPTVPGARATLANLLRQRMKAKGMRQDLEEAITEASTALEHTPKDHPHYYHRLHTLGILREDRFLDFTNAQEDMMAAIEALTEVVEITPPGNPYLVGCLSNLSTALKHAYLHTQDMEVLELAIQFSSDAVEATPQNPAHRALALQELGHNLGFRFAVTRDTKDQDRQLASYEEAWCCDDSPPSSRIAAASCAAQVYAMREDWDMASFLFREAVLLLPKVSRRMLQGLDVQAVLRNLNAATGISSSAAATVLQAGKDPLEALQVLELGRGIIAGLMMDKRMDVSDLKVSHSELADKFASLQDKLGDSADDKIDIVSLKPQEDMAGWELRLKNRRQAEEDVDQLIQEVRKLPGFNDFLSPPSARSLADAAMHGPIVMINTSRYRCDAFLIDKTGAVRVVELPDLTEEEVNNRAAHLPGDGLEGLLEWAWHTICRPCLDKLGFTTPISSEGKASLPRVWWIATGLAARLPLHAAGLHRGCSGETVMDRVMSSYAPSIRALMHGRQQAGWALSEEISESRPDVGPRSAVMVAMPETPGPGPSPLKGATKEVDWLSQKCPSLNLTAVKPVARRKDVLELLRSCHIFHFAGHGRSDPKDASRSHLLLDDWRESPLTVGDLRDNWQRGSHQPFLAYLSACSTGADLGSLRDESIHLVSAFQLAGFRHVVGTLWMVDDGACVEVAKMLYSTMADEGSASDEAVCKGLHKALVLLRDREVEEMTMADEADDFEGALRGKLRDATLDDGDGDVGLRGLWVPYVHYSA